MTFEWNGKSSILIDHILNYLSTSFPVASFVGSYSVGLLLTNRVFKQGKYTIREAAIIATGFSTVSVIFMVVMANTLNIMEYWTEFFWISLIITFGVTALTARIILNY